MLDTSQEYLKQTLGEGELLLGVGQNEGTSFN